MEWGKLQKVSSKHHLPFFFFFDFVVHSFLKRQEDLNLGDLSHSLGTNNQEAVTLEDPGNALHWGSLLYVSNDPGSLQLQWMLMWAGIQPWDTVIYPLTSTPGLPSGLGQSLQGCPLGPFFRSYCTH